MAIDAPSPLESFNFGQARGSAEGSAIGVAIENIVEDARKKGLLQFESDLGTQSAIDVASATQPFEREKLQFASDLKTEQATAEATALEPFKEREATRGTTEAVDLQTQLGPLQTQQAVEQERQTGPLKTTQAVEQERQIGPLKTTQAVDVATQTNPLKIGVAEAQAKEQGAQARTTAEEKFQREEDVNKGFVFEDPNNPVTLTLKGFPPLIRVDKKIGNRFVKQFVDARAQGLFEAGRVNKSTQGIQTLSQLQEEQLAKKNLAERGEGTEERPYILESEAEIDLLNIPEGAVVQIGEQKFTVGPEN